MQRSFLAATGRAQSQIYLYLHAIKWSSDSRTRAPRNYYTKIYSRLPMSVVI